MPKRRGPERAPPCPGASRATARDAQPRRIPASLRGPVLPGLARAGGRRHRDVSVAIAPNVEDTMPIFRYQGGDSRRRRQPLNVGDFVREVGAEKWLLAP